MHKKFAYRLTLVGLSLLLVAGIGIVGCAGDGDEATPTPVPTPTPYPTPTPLPTGQLGEMTICAARSLTGGLEMIGDFALGPILELWKDTVEGAGGGPITLNIVDDTSTMGTMTTLLSGMILDPDCDFVMPPISTAFLQAAASIVHTPGYEHVLMGAEGGCTSIGATLHGFPYLFAMLNYSNHNQMHELFKLLSQWQIAEHAPATMDIYVIYINDLHGYEYRDEFAAEAANYPGQFNIVKEVSVLPNTMDVTPQLLEAKNTYDVDVFCSFTYPPTSIMTAVGALTNNINFNALILGPGGNFEFFYDVGAGGLGPAVDGVIGFGAWNEHTSTAAADFTAAMSAKYGRAINDWWGGLFYWAGLQCFQSAVAAAGTPYNQTAVRDLLATSTFSTALGDTWFTDANDNRMITGGTSGGLMAKECHPGQVGQWQFDQHGDGLWIYEVIDIGPNNTATGVYPKPDWPTP